MRMDLTPQNLNLMIKGGPSVPPQSGPDQPGRNIHRSGMQTTVDTSVSTTEPAVTLIPRASTPYSRLLDDLTYSPVSPS